MDLRKVKVDKKIVIFINSKAGTKCASLFELKIQLTKGGDVVHGTRVEPIKTFYDQRSTLNKIESVAACVLNLNNSPNLYLTPHEQVPTPAYDPIPDNLGPELRSCIFDLNQKTAIDLTEFPQARKSRPIMIAIDQRLFVFATLALHPCFALPEPCFESLDLKSNIRSNLVSPPFNYKENFIDHERPYVLGFAVLEKEGYILVFLERNTTKYFYSYCISDDTWKTVEFPRDDFDKEPYIIGEAVVVDGHIYTYDADSRPDRLLVFSYTVDTTTHDLSVSQTSVVEGLKFRGSFESHGERCCLFLRTGAVAKVDDGTLCVLHTLCPEGYDIGMQPVCVTFIQLLPLEPAKCITLKSFTCILSAGVELSGPMIKSCFVVNDLDEKSDQRPGKGCSRS